MTELPRYCMPLLSVPNRDEHDEIVSELSLEGIQADIKWELGDIVRLWVQDYGSRTLAESTYLVFALLAAKSLRFVCYVAE